MTDVSLVELRLLSLGGLLATAVVTTLLTLLFAAAWAALGRRLQAAVERHHETSHGTRAARVAFGSETHDEARRRIA